MPLRQIVFTYWNAGLAFLALIAYCVPFAAYDLWPDDKSVGRSLFPLAPLGLLTMLGCVVVGFVQGVVLIRSFVKCAPLRFHRLCSLSILILCFALWVIAVSNGWSIRV